MILTRAVYRRRYGTDLPEASIPSRFLEEVPTALLEDLGSPRKSRAVPRERLAAESARPNHSSPHESSTHYAYEDEDQSVSWAQRRRQSTPAASYSGKSYNSIENIAEFFASRGKRFNIPKVPVEVPSGKRGFRPGQKVRHPKYGEGTVYQREGEGEEAKDGDTVSMRYTGRLASNKKEFDSTKKHNDEPFVFKLGNREVIKGWDEGVAGMKVGGKRKLIIPPALGYGAQGYPPVPIARSSMPRPRRTTRTISSSSRAA